MIRLRPEERVGDLSPTHGESATCQTSRSLARNVETLFPFTEREQEYYQERNLTHPKRCKPCRDARRSNFGGPKGAGGERQRFEITCDQCGKTDTVPFKPSTGRPVLCGDCFGANRAAQPRT